MWGRERADLKGVVGGVVVIWSLGIFLNWVVEFVWIDVKAVDGRNVDECFGRVGEVVDRVDDSKRNKRGKFPLDFICRL